jgi:hypothetical protein
MKDGCMRRNRKCKKVFCPSYIDCVDGIILKLRRVKKKTLATISKEISKYTKWDELFALNHVVKVLTDHGYKFSKAQLYYAIKKLFNEKYHYKFQKKDIIQAAKQ